MAAVWDDFIARIKSGTEKFDARSFLPLIPKNVIRYENDLDQNKVYKSCILQNAADQIDREGGFNALPYSSKAALYPYRLYRKWVNGANISIDLENVIRLFESDVFGSRFLEVAYLTAPLAVFSNREDLLGRIENAVARKFSNLKFNLYKCRYHQMIKNYNHTMENSGVYILEFLHGCRACLNNETIKEAHTLLARAGSLPPRIKQKRPWASEPIEQPPEPIGDAIYGLWFSHLRMPALILYILSYSICDGDVPYWVNLNLNGGLTELLRSYEDAPYSSLLDKDLYVFTNVRDTLKVASTETYADFFITDLFDTVMKQDHKQWLHLFFLLSICFRVENHPGLSNKYFFDEDDDSYGKMVRSIARNKTAHFALIEKVLQSQQPLLAATLAGIMHRWCEGETDEIIARATKYGCDPLFIAQREKEPWEVALEKFKELPQQLKMTEVAKASAETEEPKPFYWLLMLEPVEYYSDYFFVDDLKIWCPSARSLRMDKPFSKGKVVSFTTLYNNPNDYVLSYEDQLILQYARGFMSNSTRRSQVKFSDDDLNVIIPLLEGHPRLAVSCEKVVSGITLGKYETTIDTSIDPDDHALYISRPIEQQILISEYKGMCMNLVLRRNGSDRMEYPVMPFAVKQAIDIIDTQGRYGSVVIPEEEIKRVMPVLTEFTKHIPVSGSIFDNVDESALPRVEIDSTPVVRMTMSDEETLNVDVRILIDLGISNLAYPPGTGPGKMTSRHLGDPVLMVRNLQEEKLHGLTVQSVIQKWTDVKKAQDASYQINGLESILDFIAEMHDLKDQFRLEWMNSNALKLSSVLKAQARASAKSVEHWFGVQGEFNLDDGRVLSFQELLRLLPQSVGKYIRLSDGAYLRLSERLRKKLEVLNAAGTMKKDEILLPFASLPALGESFASEEAENPNEPPFELPPILKDGVEKVQAELARTVDEPSDLRAVLRPYQKDGYTWLSHLAALGIGSCLADDMGLGKTLELIAVLLERSVKGPSLVVAPSSLCFNWEKEVRRFAPTLNVKVLHGLTATKDEVTSAQAGDVIVTSYGMIVSREDIFASREWNCLVLDEAQAIKNDLTKRFRSVKALKGDVRIVATGTPVENRIGDFWSLFDFLNPGMLLSKEKFAERYTREGMATTELKTLVSPLILRRLKNDVLKELPPKTEINLSVELGDDERAQYEACRLHALEMIEKMSDEQHAGKKGMVVLAELTKLRRFCCHPSLVQPMFQISAKLEMLENLLMELKNNNHKALIFSQYVDYLAIVQKMIQKNGWDYQYLDGATTQKGRRDSVNDFQSGKSDFFLISLKAGGFGLTLTAASYVILLDPWWNPAVENQAADRVHRIGQTKPVTVYRLVAKDTVEERVLALHDEKLKIAEDILEGTAATSLSTEEMLNLFR